MTDDIRLPSGSVLHITLLPYEDSWSVFQEVSAFMEKVKFDFKSIDWEDYMKSDVAALSSPLLSIASSKEIIAAAKKCFCRVTVNGLKIDSMTFEAKELRKDFIPTVFLVLRENIAPFFDKILSYLPKK